MTHPQGPSPANACPLCQKSNGCRLACTNPPPGPCWCERAEIPDELLRRVPEPSVRRACLCAQCVDVFHQQRKCPPETRIDDHYFDPDGRMVFTESYHRRRGYCCGSGCRHCPYDRPAEAPQP